MTTLGPDCDPDLSRGSAAPAPPGLRSTLVLVVLLAATGWLAVGGAVSLWLAVPAGAVAVLAAWALVRRAARAVRGASGPRPVARPA